MTAEMKLFSNCLGFFVQLLKKLDIPTPTCKRNREPLKYPCNFMHSLYITCCHTHIAWSQRWFEYTMVVVKNYLQEHAF
jgi:hypothetical protein